jgi:NADH dehydrogenase
VLGHLPGKVITSDQVKLLRVDNVVSDAAKKSGRTLEGMGIVPRTMHAVLPTYLWRFRTRGQFQSTKGTA